jgi:hypothetical protein
MAQHCFGEFLVGNINVESVPMAIRLGWCVHLYDWAVVDSVRVCLE